MRLVSIQRLLRRGAITNLAKMLARMHPADIANVIDHLSSLKEKREIFELVRGDVKRGQVLSELDGESITLVLSDLLPSDAAWLLKDLGSDDIAYILSVIPNDRAKEILALMRTEDSTEIADLRAMAEHGLGHGEVLYHPICEVPPRTSQDNANQS